MKITSVCCAAAATLSVCLWSKVAVGGGNAGGEEAPAELEGLVVTAALVPLAASQVASSVTVITREDIERRQVKYLVDLLRGLPGFSVSQSGGPGAQTQVRLRGAEANHLLVLIDGARANDPASADEFQWQYALAADIERIEIVRGPQSSIWGADALAGVINIIRRRDLATSRAGGRMEAGSFNTRDLAAHGGLVREGLELYGSVAHHRSDGINIARYGTEDDGTRNTTAHLRLDWRPNADWSLGLSGQHVTAESDFDAIDFIITGLPVDADNVTDARRSYMKGELRFEPPGDRYSVDASVNFSDSSNRNLSEGVWDGSTGADAMELRLRGSLSLPGGGTGRRGHRLTAGLSHSATDYAQRGIASPFGDPNQNQSLDQTGLALEYVGHESERLTWTVGARHDAFSEFADRTTWRLGASHQFHERTRIWGSWGSGIKTPTFTERFGFFNDLFIGNPRLKPETSEGWEVGLDTRWLQDRLELGVSWFSYDLEDEIDGFVFDPVRFLFTAENRDTRSDRDGLELTLTARLATGLSLSAAYSHTDATETGAGGIAQREVRRPRHQASLTAHYRFAADRASLNLDVLWRDRQQDLFFDPATFLSRRVSLDGHLVADLAGAWRLSDSLELVARVRNLTGEDYEEVLGFSRPGRAWYGGLRGRFDF